MSAKSKIEWTDATWNPIRGCSKVSPGCEHCYAMEIAARFSGPGLAYEGLAKRNPTNWTGEVRMIADKLLAPLSWRRPRKVFVNSTSDLFHENLPDEWIDKIFAVMALCPQHTFQVLTKRARRMADYMTGKRGTGLWSGIFDLVGPTISTADDVSRWCKKHGVSERERYRRRDVLTGLGGFTFPNNDHWPLRNVWFGVSVEDRKHGLPRIGHLLAAPASVRFLSIEPLLEDLGGFDISGIDWVIVGGESGKDARPMHPDWARSIRDQCQAAGVPFFFKQWGEWAPGDESDEQRLGVQRIHASNNGRAVTFLNNDGSTSPLEGACRRVMFRVGKKAAGRLLDGREWNEFPEVARA